MSLIDVVIHPQAVFCGFEADDPGLSNMEALVARSLHLGPGDKSGLDSHRELDWDIWVQIGERLNRVPDHMHLLTFATGDVGSVSTSYGSTSVQYSKGSPGPTMTVAPELPAEIDRLVRNELVPWLQEQRPKPVLSVFRGGTISGRRELRINEPDIGLVPFVSDADGNVIAGAFPRPGNENSWVWVLPHVPPRPELWLMAAMRDWSTRTPSRVPVGLPWRARDKWRTNAELKVAADLAVLETERREWEDAYRVRREALEAEELAAAVDADRGPRRLLTSQDDALTEAVANALRRLGFTATDEDAKRSSGQGKAHDLNVLDPDWSNKTIIVEVKGMSKGGRGALAQANQHVLRFAVAHEGRTPDRCWLVLNHFRELDPDERPTVLQGADEDIALFGENGGLLLDSRDLFLMVQALDRGEATAAELRASLRSARGRFEL